MFQGCRQVQSPEPTPDVGHNGAESARQLWIVFLFLVPYATVVRQCPWSLFVARSNIFHIADSRPRGPLLICASRRAPPAINTNNQYASLSVTDNSQDDPPPSPSSFCKTCPLSLPQPAARRAGRDRQNPEPLAPRPSPLLILHPRLQIPHRARHAGQLGVLRLGNLDAYRFRSSITMSRKSMLSNSSCSRKGTSSFSSLRSSSGRCRGGYRGWLL